MHLQQNPSPRYPVSGSDFAPPRRGKITAFFVFPPSGGSEGVESKNKFPV
jgi:hypothetical protein